MRLRHRRDFQRVYRGRCRVSDASLTICIAPNDLDVTRLGLSVSRRLGGAVVRNRIKRRLREAFRLLGMGRRQPGYDVICIPRTDGNAPATVWRDSIRLLFERGQRKLAKRHDTR